MKIHHKYEKQQKLQNINKKKRTKKKFNAVQGNETLKQKKNKKEKDLKLSKLPSC